MSIRMENCIGQTLEIVYMDQKNRLTQRKVILWSVDHHTVYAYCLWRKSPRRFKRANILAVRQDEERMWA